MNATITWDGTTEELIARDDSGKVIAKVDHESPIDASTNSLDIAHAVFNADEVLEVDHDGRQIHVVVDGQLYQIREEDHDN